MDLTESTHSNVVVKNAEYIADIRVDSDDVKPCRWALCSRNSDRF
jgi:hypothetical protein